MLVRSFPPARVDRIIVHQFDPARPSPGGIDSCIRGILRYLPDGVDVAVVGVDTGISELGSRRVGQWEEHRLAGGRIFWFLPVASLDPADQARKVPHSARLMLGVLRYRLKLPMADIVQVHRMDSAVALRVLIRRPLAYFIHTQEDGLTGKTSDSIWRFAARAHRRLEFSVVQRAKSVVVFNESYSKVVRKVNPYAVFSPTWFDPRLIQEELASRDQFKILWVGRFEVPKDPVLAIETFDRLLQMDPSSPWSLDMVGSGTLLDLVKSRVNSLPRQTAERIRLMGRVAPEDVAVVMAQSGIFLMTSHPGYEGFPRVLVESMASGLPSVVTAGSDTGGLVHDGITGFVSGRQPEELAEKLRVAVSLDRDPVRKAVKRLDAPSLVRRILALDHVEIAAVGAS
jgi:glycosyltransferase involved in cell wall biosynthesis